MQKAFYVCFIFGWISAFSATDYFVATDGSDDNPGTTLDAPFKTIQKAAGLVEAGGTVYIRSGTYRETVTPKNSGNASSPITFRPYQRESVVIDGTEPVEGWQSAGNLNGSNKIYKAPLPADFFQSGFRQTGQLFVDGEMIRIAHWPAAGLDPFNRKFSSLTEETDALEGSPQNPTPITLKDSQNDFPVDHWKGAEIFVLPSDNQWSWTTTGMITSSKPGQLVMEVPRKPELPNGWPVHLGKPNNHPGWPAKSRYFLYNSLNALTSPGMWYHDKEEGMAYLWTPESDDPSSHQVTVKKREFGFVLDKMHHIVLRGLAFHGTTVTTDLDAGTALPSSWGNNRKKPAEAHHITLDSIRARYIFHSTHADGHFNFQWTTNSGIVLAGNDMVIQNSFIQYSSGNGITSLGDRNKVLNNIIREIGYLVVDCGFIHAGNEMETYDQEWAFNTCINSGRSGIRVGQMKNSDPGQLKARVHHNNVSRVMHYDADGAAIHSVGLDGNFLRVDHNVIHDVFGYNREKSGVGGIYWDFCRNYITDHNVVYNVNRAFTAPGNKDNKDVNGIIYNNTFWSSDDIPRWDDNKHDIYNVYNVWDKYPHNGSVIRNNILRFGVFIGGSYTQDHNLIETEPEFVAYELGDLTLQSGSPAIDQGTVITSVNRDGVEIPAINNPYSGEAPDMGAYEYGKPEWRAGADLDTTWSTAPTAISNNRKAESDWRFADGVFQTGNQMVEISIFDLKGKLIHKSFLKGNTSFRIGDLRLSTTPHFLSVRALK